MDIVTLILLLLPLGAILLMSRSAKKRQQQAVQMRDQLQPGTGVRTIGGMYAMVKEVRHDTLLLEVAPGVHAVYAKSAVAAVLETEEYERIVSGDTAGDGETDADAPATPDASSPGTGEARADGESEPGRPELSKTADAGATAADAEPEDAERRGDADAK